MISNNNIIFSDLVNMIILSTEDPSLREKLCNEKLALLHKTTQVSQELFNNTINSSSEDLFKKMMNEDSKLYKKQLPGLGELVRRVSIHIQDFNSPEISSNMRTAVIDRISTLLQQPLMDHTKTSSKEEEALRNQAEKLRQTLISYDKSFTHAQESIDQLENALENENSLIAIDEWIADYGKDLGPAVWNKLSYSNSLNFYTILKRAELVAPELELMDFVKNAPKQIKNSYETCHISSNEKFFSKVNQYNKTNEEQKFIEIAHYIQIKRIPINSLLRLEYLSENDCLNLAPYLRYADLTDCSPIIIKKFLTDCSNVQTLLISDDEITELPPLPKCKKLDCKDCNNLKELPQLPLCQILICRGCKTLLQLPMLPICRELDCNNCQALLRLPALPKCQWLNCQLCENLVEIPELLVCQKLRCNGCILLTQLPALLLCTELNCNNCQALLRLPALPKCQWLNCQLCENLVEIPELTACLFLDCSHCKKLSQLPETPLCRMLYCLGCEILVQLPDLSKCEKLNCSYCTAFQEIPPLPLCQTLHCNNCIALQQLPDLPLCRDLKCSNCSALQQLPDLPLCRNLECSNCNGLQQLPDLPLCRNLECSNCNGLQQIPALPNCERIDYRGCNSLQQPLVLPNIAIIVSQISSVKVSEFHMEISQFKNEPSQLLFNLGKDHLLKNSSFPKLYYYENGTQNLAIDVGGVKRDFVTRLMENIFKPESEIEKNPDQVGKFLSLADGFPKMDPHSNTETAYRSLGRLLAQCISKDSTLKTGPLFADPFYEYLLTYSSTDPISSMCTMFCGLRDLPSEILDFILNGTPLSGDNALFTFSYILDEEDPMDIRELKEELEKNPSEYREKAKNIIEKTMREDKRFQALALIASEINKALGEEVWKDLLNEGALSLKDRIEGKLNAELLLNQLAWTASEGVSEDNFEKTKSFVRSWISVRASQYEQLEKFVQVITSNKTLCNEKLKIEIYNRPAESIPLAHTCFFSLEVPCTYESQEVFDNKMELLLTEGLAESGFQFA